MFVELMCSVWQRSSDEYPRLLLRAVGEHGWDVTFDSSGSVPLEGVGLQLQLLPLSAVGVHHFYDVVVDASSKLAVLNVAFGKSICKIDGGGG